MKNPTSLKQLEAAASAAKGASVKFYQTLARLNLAAQKQRQEFVRNLELSGVKGKDAAKLIQQQAATVRKELASFSQKDRIAIYKPIMEAREALAYAKSEMTEPRRLASTFMLGSEERNRIEQTISQMGLGAMASMAKRAMADPDSQESKLLAAVLCLAVDNVTPSARPFSSNELSEKVFGAEAQAVKNLVSVIEQEAQSIQAINTSWESGKPIPSNIKIALGIQFEGINISQAIEGDDPEVTVESLTALQKIAGALAGTPDRTDSFGNTMNSLQEAKDSIDKKIDDGFSETKRLIAELEAQEAA